MDSTWKEVEAANLEDNAHVDDDDDDLVSDADSDEMELRGDIAKYEQSVREFLSSHHTTGASAGAGIDGDDGGLRRAPPISRSKHASRSIRGPRKAAEPRGDIKLRLAGVNQAFMSGNYALARDLVFEIIRINAETHQAWTVLASIFREEGANDQALMAMVISAHLRPKDFAVWMDCASFAMSLAEGGQEGALKTALMCYSSAIKAQPTSLEARLGRAEASHRQGFFSQAITEFTYVIERRPLDIDVVRRLAEACADSGGMEDVQKAVSAYKTYFAHARSIEQEAGGELSWHDIGIYVELFACAGDFANAIADLKSLSRWLLGRPNDQLWDACFDDREWDRDHSRRVQIPSFDPSAYNMYTYGMGLPLEFRARLALYRLKIRDDEESDLHLQWLDPTESATATAIEDFPYLVRDIADELCAAQRYQEALDYYELLRHSVYGQDATLLLQLGRCYLRKSDNVAAEDCFLVAIQVDETNIDARYELATIYEKAKEEEEAYILVTEAIALQGINDEGGLASDSRGDMRGIGSHRLSGSLASGLADGAKSRRRREYKRRPANSGIVRPRYRPKRLIAPDQRMQEERARADELTRRYEVVRSLKKEIQAGDHSLIPTWMAAAGDLVGEFRSFRKFYPWDKYLKFLGAANDVVFSASSRTQPGLSELAERLSKNMAPSLTDERRTNVTYEDDGYRGIPFGEWLELFLDYAISLALDNRAEEAYQVCEAARDSIVFVNSKDYMFLIHVAWAACAIYLSDEEMCVAVARFFMKVRQLDSDSYRMFAALCRLCQSPASWYNSGPAQKYILRQIKIIDASHLGTAQADRSYDVSVGDRTSTGEAKQLDTCLLMLYGHILFTSTSYTFALNYFLRARTLDPLNPMISLSVGLGYIHHALKRQADNRQYLIMQGFACVFEFCHSKLSGPPEEKREAFFGVARTFHMLGLHHLALEWYRKVIDADASDGVEPRGNASSRDVILNAAYNEYALLISSGSVDELEQSVLPRLVL
ncbi:RNA polymerase III transcription factor tfiiic [Colletotrichum tamarilloi]|uniref:RNA polymerase III transcription factor tfiiic n=1 Tax=Colletotrichum tamarilloi TaxID=1209934 RepID=A0ABQ9RR69_9PEZI|nr:RNA polymerase III transcription factor tfiiic [Colletotrichum tamarilloi]KAI3535594.1 RNA polymerase III transcription factor tfiiic [Colletotrichum filicis]KAK1509981.1 RNA polymerase III transcription factor tfiiic [Colletotrichum tamarilloi]